MSDYFRHWLNIGKRLAQGGAKPPKIFCVNWFRTNADGKFIWPGFGDNMRVLKWMLDRISGAAGGEENVFGVTPRHADLHWDGLDFGEALYEQITAIDRAAWEAELQLHDELFDKLSHRLPAELGTVKAALQSRLAS
jgi:phosphoenolpyruvate carboxykinase (GTP)